MIQSVKKGIDAEARFLTIARGIGCVAEDVPVRIRGVRPADPCEDGCGIDAFVVLQCKDALLEVPIQVKSSPKGVRKYKKKYPEYIERGVIVMVINNTYSNDMLARVLIEQLLNVYYTRRNFTWLYDKLTKRKQELARTIRRG